MPRYKLVAVLLPSVVHAKYVLHQSVKLFSTYFQFQRGLLPRQLLPGDFHFTMAVDSPSYLAVQDIYNIDVA